MTTANKLTIARILMVPVFLIVLHLDIPYARYAALVVFALASLTDFLDGFIARHFHQITTFGKFMDPLADKILTVSAMCYFVQCGQMQDWMLALVLLREFAISGVRLIAAERGRVIAAAWSGKIKTSVTMLCLLWMLLAYEPWMPIPAALTDALCGYLIVGTTLYSGAEYLYKNRDMFGEEEKAKIETEE